VNLIELINGTIEPNTQIHFSAKGVGDAVRIASIIKKRIDPAKKQVVVMKDQPDLGVRVIRNLTFIDQVIPVPVQYYKPMVIDYLKRNYQKAWEPMYIVNPDNIHFRLDVSDLKAGCKAAIPGRYIVVQPASTLYKNWSIPFQKNLELPTILIGSEKDRAIKANGDIDLRGKLSIEEAIWVVAHCQRVVGVESWCAITACTFGKPATMYCNLDSLNRYGPEWRKAWPLLDLRELS